MGKISKMETFSKKRLFSTAILFKKKRLKLPINEKNPVSFTP